MTQENQLLPDTETELDQNKKYLDELVGESKKFKTVEDLAKSKVYADQTIEVYKKRMDEMREDLLQQREENMSKAKLEELIDKLTTQRLASSETTPAKEVQQPAPIDSKEIETLFDRKLQQFELNKKSEENLSIVVSKLKERYGDNYRDSLQKQITDLGLTTEYANDLAKRSPNAFIRTFGLEQSTHSFDSPPRSSQRNDTFAPTGTQKRTWSYYQELKKKDPMAWLDPKIAVQMSKDAVELGSAFKDGDYFRKGLHDE